MKEVLGVLGESAIAQRMHRVARSSLCSWWGLCETLWNSHSYCTEGTKITQSCTEFFVFLVRHL